MLPQSQRRSESEGEDESRVMNNKKTEVVKYDHNSKMVPNTWGTSKRKKTKNKKKHCSSHRSSSKQYTLYICQLIHGGDLSLLKKKRDALTFSVGVCSPPGTFNASTRSC